MMRKIGFLAVILALALSLAGCGGITAEAGPKPSAPAVAPTATPKPTANVTAPGGTTSRSIDGGMWDEDGRSALDHAGDVIRGDLDTIGDMMRGETGREAPGSAVTANDGWNSFNTPTGGPYAAGGAADAPSR